MAIKITPKTPVSADDAPPLASAAPADQLAEDNETPPWNGEAVAVAEAKAAAAEEAAQTAAAKKATKKTTKKVTKAVADPAPGADSDPPEPVVAAEAEAVAAEPEKIENVQPVATIEIQHATGVKETTTEPVGPVVAKTAPMANVGVSFGFTHGLPGYSNVKASVSLFMPAVPTLEGVNETYTFVESWVDSKIAQLRDDLTSGDE